MCGPLHSLLRIRLLATIEHKNITDNNIHEPKGASTADEGEIYIADGAGSGTWTKIKTGWGYYKDNASAQTFTTTPTRLSIDGAGSTSTSAYLPLEIRGTDELWNTTGDYIKPIALGDSYVVRLDLPITNKNNAQYAEVQLDIGGGASPSTVILTKRIETDRTAPFNHSLTMNLFSLSTFMANGCQIFISVNTGSIDITAPSILISREHGEV